MRVFFDRWGTGDAAHVFAGFIGRPYVAAVDEGDAVGAEVWLAEEAGFLGSQEDREEKKDSG